MTIKISDIKLHLTQVQYCLLIALLRSIPRVLASAPAQITADDLVIAPQPKHEALPDSASGATVDLRPEVRPSSTSNTSSIWTTIDIFVNLDVVKLHLYDERASTEDTLREHGIARFALNASTLRAKSLSDGSMEVELVLKSFTMSNTRPGNSKFREIMPAAQHGRNQVMVLYTVSGGTTKPGMAIVTVDSPQIIFAVEPIMGLLAFFTSAADADVPSAELEDQTEDIETSPPAAPSLNIRLDLHDVLVSVLENDADADSRAIRLSIKQIFLSQQVWKFVAHR